LGTGYPQDVSGRKDVQNEIKRRLKGTSLWNDFWTSFKRPIEPFLKHHFGLGYDIDLILGEFGLPDDVPMTTENWKE